MNIIEQLLVILGASLIIYFILLFLVLYFTYRMIKKYPILAFFILIILISIGIAGLNPITLVPAITTITGSVIVIIKEYSRLKKAINNAFKRK